MSTTTTAQPLSTIEKIITALDELKEIHGTEHLTYEIIKCSSKTWVRVQLRALEETGQISIERSPGGRGCKNIIRRKNRNSPGAPSKRDKHRRQVP